jgi:hypothetical protein
MAGSAEAVAVTTIRAVVRVKAFRVLVFMAMTPVEIACGQHSAAKLNAG